MKTAIKICVGSLNPVKINAAKQAFETVFATYQIIATGMNAPSEVADQPMTSDETRLGAINRASYCQSMDRLSEFDYYVAMEGGVDFTEEEGASTFAYLVIKDKHNSQSVGRTASLPLPVSIYNRLRGGDELGPLMDELFKTENIKQKGGAIGLLTNNHATRGSTYQQAMILALAPFIHPTEYR